ncbi:MAG: M23 family metallopeptidase [Chloroflexi bacterium]|nr:M23 family metallopeptidase [Chloroflexota bacterium]
MVTPHKRLGLLASLLALGAVLLVAPVSTALASPPASVAWQQKSSLSLPVAETAYISQGWDGTISHQDTARYGIDFLIVDRWGWSYAGWGRRLSDYHTWGKPVLAAADGVVVALESSIADNEPRGEPNMAQPWGNYVIIDHGNGEYSLVAHLRQGAVSVRIGQQVSRGEQLGLAGNSGFSLAPHVHYQLQDGPGLNANSLPATFSSYYQVYGLRETQRTDQAPQQGTFVRSASLGRAFPPSRWRMIASRW